MSRNIKHPATVVGTLILLLAVTPTWAGLTFENRRIALHPKPTQTTITGEFTFRNTGEQDVTITAVRAACGCTTAELAKTTYAPGETGAIRATFEPGDRAGKQSKNIVIHTDAAKNPVTTLTLTAHEKKREEKGSGVNN